MGKECWFRRRKNILPQILKPNFHYASVLIQLNKFGATNQIFYSWTTSLRYIFVRTLQAFKWIFLYLLSSSTLWSFLFLYFWCFLTKWLLLYPALLTCHFSKNLNTILQTNVWNCHKILPKLVSSNQKHSWKSAKGNTFIRLLIGKNSLVFMWVFSKAWYYQEGLKKILHTEVDLST